MHFTVSVFPHSLHKTVSVLFFSENLPCSCCRSRLLPLLLLIFGLLLLLLMLKVLVLLMLLVLVEMVSVFDWLM